MMSFMRFQSIALLSAVGFALLFAGCGDDRVARYACVDGTLSPTCECGGPTSGCCSDHGGIVVGSCPLVACPSTFDRMCPSATGEVACVPVSSDPNNCGACGNRCGATEICRAGACAPGMVRPDGGGIDLGPPGACSPSCPSTQRCCGTSCVTRMVPPGTDGRADRSFQNCGGCGMICDVMTASACSGTACTCGTLGRACAAGQICTNTGGGFSCQSDCGGTGPCAAGGTCCGAGAEAMCFNTQLDALNCGTCGNACGPGTACTAGVCAPLCGSVVCGAGQLCCGDVCTPSGDANCGACGVTCASTDICGLLFLTATTCCGEETFPGSVFECSPPADGGTPDAGPGDAGVLVDAGAPDAAPSDAGAMDASTVDGG